MVVLPFVALPLVVLLPLVVALTLVVPLVVPLLPLLLVVLLFGWTLALPLGPQFELDRDRGLLFDLSLNCMPLTTESRSATASSDTPDRLSLSSNPLPVLRWPRGPRWAAHSPSS